MIKNKIVKELHDNPSSVVCIHGTRVTPESYQYSHKVAQGVALYHCAHNDVIFQPCYQLYLDWQSKLNLKALSVVV